MKYASIVKKKKMNYGTIIVQNGLPALYSVSISRNDGLHERLHRKTRLKVHKDCRRHYTKASSIKSALKFKECEY